MIRQIKLQRKPGDKAKKRYIYLQFKDGNTTYVVSRNSNQICKASELTVGDEVKMITIADTSPPYLIRYDEDSKHDDDLNAKELVRLLKTHMSVRVVLGYDGNGNPMYDRNINAAQKLNSHQLDLIDDTAVHTQNVEVLNRQIKNLNVVKQMNPRQRADVLYHFGHDPIGMKNSEMFMRLADLHSGLVVSRRKYDSVSAAGGERDRTYLEYFSEVYDPADQSIYLDTTFKKGLVIRRYENGPAIIERKKNSGYFMGDIFLGMTLGDAKTKIMKDEKLFSLLQRDVEKRDDTPEDDIPTLIGKTDEEVAKVAETVNPDANHKHLLAVCRERFKMVLEDNIALPTLEKLFDEGKSMNQKFNSSGLISFFEANPDFTYDVMVAECERMKKTIGANPPKKERLDYLAQRQIELDAEREAKLQEAG